MYPEKFWAYLALSIGMILMIFQIFEVVRYDSLITGKNCKQGENQRFLMTSLLPNERAKDLLSRMSIDEKIGQMILVSHESIRTKLDIVRYNIGAIVNGGGDSPSPNTPQGWLDMVNDLQGFARTTCFNIPLLYGADTIHGHSNVEGATIFPHFIGLGATQDEVLVEKIGKATADEMMATNIYWGYSPNLDVTQDIRWGRAYETFGSDPELVSRLGKAYIRGFQKKKDGVSPIATAKHFVGNGSMVWGSSKEYIMDKGGSFIIEKELREIHIKPFKEAIKEGVGSIMIGLNSWKGEKVTSSHYLVTDVLKKELGFTGLVISDWYGAYETDTYRYNALVKSVNAGIDMVMLPYDYISFTDDMRQAIKSGDIPITRLNDAVEKILTKKFELGLFDRENSQVKDLSTVGSQAHRTLAREAVRKSLVLLKNSGSVLPISKDVRSILVSGSSADNLGRQSGGWTIEWQGVDGNIFPGTTILAGIRRAVSRGTEIIYDKGGNIDKRVGIGIAIVGESPYAEGKGDNSKPSLSQEDLDTIEKTRQNSEKLVVIIVSGRPLQIEDDDKNWGAIVEAWLPGSEGEGVSDVIFGDFPFTGKMTIKQNP